MFGKALQTLLRAHALHALSADDTDFADRGAQETSGASREGELAVRRHSLSALSRLDVGRPGAPQHRRRMHRRPPRHAGRIAHGDDRRGRCARHELHHVWRARAAHVALRAAPAQPRASRPAIACWCGLPNSIDYPTAFLGAMKRGAIAVPTSTLLTADEVRYLLEDSGAAALVIDAAAWNGDARRRSEGAGKLQPRDHRRRCARARAREDRKRRSTACHPARRSGVSRLYVRHDGLSEGRAARAPLARRPLARLALLVRLSQAAKATASSIRASSTGPTCWAPRSWTRSHAARP